MKEKTYILTSAVLLAAMLVGCSTDTPQATPEEKKSFQGSAMPKDFMKNMDQASKAAQDAQSKAAANNGAPK